MSDPSAASASAAPAPATRAWPLALACVLVLATVVRLAYLRQFAALPIFDQPIGDSAAHLARAFAIAHGKLLPARPFYYCSIFYPYFLALVMGVFHGSLFTVSALQLLAGVATVGILAVTARLAFGVVAGIATGVLAALYGPAAFFEADLLGVAGGQLALAAALLGCVWLAVRAGEGGAAAWSGIGLLLGLAAVERPNLLVVAAGVIAWAAATAGARRTRAIASVAGGVALPLLVVLALNVAGTGQWVPLTTSGGINLALAYHAGANGTYDEPWEREAPEFSARHVEPEEAMTAWASRKVGRPLTTQEASAYWGRQAVAYIATHPGAALRVTLRKAALLLNATEVPNHLDFAFLRAQVPALRWMPVGFGAVFALAVAGAWLALRGRRGARAAWLCLLFAGGAWLSLVPFTVADRYRMPMLPGLLVLAGAGVALLLEAWRAHAPGRAREWAIALGLGAAALAVASVPMSRPLPGRNEWMFAQAYERRGQLPQALAAYEAAARVDSTNGEILNNLGNLYRRLGQPGSAAAALERAARVEPDLAYPHKSLGLLDVAQGRYDSAAVELGRAARIDSADAEVLAMLGALHAERGDTAAARASFERARALAPGDARLERLIAHYGLLPPAQAGR